ncbi:alkaline ceramidase TOD1 isoform X1 [Magnolia sinica]|uniref:alkaline ceramidase TOD1 isoform X1 n=1 Tax=Magnolia sinica TaxID=86752 RepID=UPI00265A72DD|nr:alkaline ceramidase TOD1 isoform X1 [Magnolia sinica]
MPTPPLFQSKLLCFSLFYLFTALFLSLYASLSNTKCIFQSPLLDPIQHALFNYPSSYGEHKYAISTVHSCTSPVYFSDYQVVLKEIQDFYMNSSNFPSVLRYLTEGGESFGGNFSTQKRKSYFDHRDDEVEVPCGFMKNFPVSDSDRLAMENCRGVVVASAIFDDHDKIRQPRGLSVKTLEIVCFFMFIDDSTIAGLNSHNIPIKNNKIGAWRIVRVSGKLPYKNPAMNGVIPKHLIHRLFPNSRFSIWVDAKLQLTVDPLLLIHALVISENADMALSKHPHNIHTIEEAIATARWKKWGDVELLRMQMETYCENGLQPWTPDKLPYASDVPDTALILRKHGLASNLWSCLVFNELEAFNPRDQLAFAYVRDLMRPQIKINMFEVEAFEHIAVEYRHNLKRGVGGGPDPSEGQKRIKMPIRGAINGSRCERYLLTMWGEPHDS